MMGCNAECILSKTCFAYQPSTMILLYRPVSDSKFSHSDSKLSHKQNSELALDKLSKVYLSMKNLLASQDTNTVSQGHCWSLQHYFQLRNNFPQLCESHHSHLISVYAKSFGWK